MRLYASDSSFAVGGQHYEGFPILVDSAGVVVEVVLRFFVSELLGRAGANDRKTWDAYGRHLYDYFGYLEAKGLRWDRIPQLDGGDVSPLAHYVHWCHSTVGNLPGYVNDKRGTVERFYVWALKAGLINELPSSKVEEPSQGGGGRLVNAAAGPGRRLKSKLHVADPKALLPVLTRSQIETVLKAATNATHREMLHLGLNAGLRAEELTTFPKHYVVDCRNLPDKVKTVSVRLSPNDMDTKNS